MMKGTGKVWRAIVALAIVGAVGFAAISCKTDVDAPDGTQGQTKYKVSFDVDGGSPVEAQQVEVGKQATRPGTNPTKSGHTFDNWYTTSAHTAQYDFATAVTGNITIYAKWNAVLAGKHAVNFSTDGGSPVPETHQVDENGFATRPTTNPTRTGFTFDDWYDAATGGAVFAFATKQITVPTTVYARWTPPVYTVASMRTAVARFPHNRSSMASTQACRIQSRPRPVTRLPDGSLEMRPRLLPFRTRS